MYGTLWLTTGLHTGNVGFTVEVHDRAPPLDSQWEDVVEVSFHPASGSSALVQDCYLLQIWTAPPAPDRILRQTSR